MAAPPGSQTVTLPSNLPFRLVSKTIGAGAYASIRKAVPLGRSTPVIAVKFINKDHAMKVGRLTPRQIALEISIHREVCAGKVHKNIIRLLEHGEDPAWYWIAMELAEGGDLFDKIEADEGVPQDVAHFYFRQLVSAVSWCHSKGMAHRDIKPENMLLSGDGDLKLADFGLAVAFMDTRSGKRKTCATVCGSPPYIAPEIIATGLANRERKRSTLPTDKASYDPDTADLWSCAIVLFVLLVGNTPWDSPVADTSAEFADFILTNGRPSDELWDNIPPDVLSLIRGTLRVSPTERFTLEQITTHPWYLQPNRWIDGQGRTTDSVALATTMMSRLRVDIMSSPTPRRSESGWGRGFAHTQPEGGAAPALALHDDYLTLLNNNNNNADEEWEPTGGRHGPASASQPTTAIDLTSAAALADAAANLLETDVSLSQFTTTPGLPLTLTQAARRFDDIAPREALTRFYSTVPEGQLLDTLTAALLELGMGATRRGGGGGGGGAASSAGPGPRDGRQGPPPPPPPRQCGLYVHGVDGRKQELKGHVLLATAVRGGLSEVRFVKAKGDPVEWRRLFKAVVRRARDVVFVPGEAAAGRVGWSSQV